MFDNAINAPELYRISQHGEPYLYSISRDTFEKKKAADNFHAIYGEKLETKDTLYIVLGTDGGLLVDHILEKGLPYGSRYLFIEHQNIIDSIEAQLTFTEWDDKVEICTLENWQEVAEKHKIHSYLFTEKIEYIKSISAIDGYDARYYEYNDAINLTIASIKHKTIMSLSRRPFIERNFENLAENAIPFIQLENKFEGKTCVVLGGGPSLDRHTEWLKENRESFIVLAVSRIARKLINDGITPDLIFSVDPYDVSFDVSKEMLNLPESVIFVHSNYVVPTLSGQWAGKQLYCGSRTPWESDYSPTNLDLQGPTVTNYALSGAIHLGFERILLSGFDLCYAKNGMTYASNSNEAKVGPMLNLIGQWVDTYNGDRAETSTSFLHASYVLNDQAKLAETKGSTVINLSSTAIKLDNIEQLSPTEISLTPDPHLRDIFDSIEIHSSKEQGPLKGLIKEVDKLLKDIVAIDGIAKQALKDNSALYKTYKSEEKNHKIKLKLDKAENQLTTRYEKTNLFLKKFGIKNFIKVVRTDGDQDWSDEEMEETGRIYYQAYVDTIEDIRPLLASAKQRLKSRIDEFNPKANVKKLIEQWQEDKQYNRGKSWKRTYSTQFDALPEEQKLAFEELAEKHQYVIENQDTAHLKRTQTEASLTGVNRKIVYLFQRKNRDGLAQLLVNLIKAAEDNPAAQWLVDLCEAYIAIMNDDTRAAFNSLTKIDDHFYTEDEAIQLSSIALKLEEIETATKYLEKLAQLSDIHKPRYATILKIQQKFDQAEAVYIEYLEQNPNDTRIVLALINLYQTINKNEKAIPYVEQILATDPNNVEAKALFEILSNPQNL